MAETIRAKMPPSQRAKQFAPFDALSGLGAALERKRRELERTERPILAEERCADLNDALCALLLDDLVTVRYYRRGAQRTVTGAVTAIDGVAHTLTVDETRVPFADLLDIQRL